MSGNLRDATTRVASWRDETFLYTDRMSVQGDVQAPDDTLHINTRLLAVEPKNLHDPEGLPDAGLFARELDINVGRQAVISGWVNATDLIALDVWQEPGSVFYDDDYITPIFNDLAGPLSLRIDTTALMTTSADGSIIIIYSQAAIENAGQIEVKGDGSTIDMSADGPLILVQFSRVFAEGDNSTVRMVSGRAVR